MKPESVAGIDIERRSFLVKTAGIVGAAFGGLGLSGCAKRPVLAMGTKDIFVGAPEKTTVSITAGTDRRRMITDAVQPFLPQLQEAIGDRQVLIKINCNRPDVQLIKTHPDAVRGVLDCLKTFYTRQVLVGESTSQDAPTRKTYDHYGFYALEKEYNARLVELNDWPVVYRWILDKDLQPERIRVLSPFLDPAFYIISVTPLKTHGNVVATLSLKNIVMGAPMKRPQEGINDKMKMHGLTSRVGNKSTTEAVKLINLNILQLAQSVRPDFSVLDGFVGAEGDGPNSCEPVDHKIAVAGFDFLSVDTIGCELMGIPWEKVGYLRWSSDIGLGQADRSKIKIVGEDMGKHIVPYKLPKNVQWCYKWEDPIDWGLIHTK